MPATSQFRPLLRVGLPVAVAVVFVCLAVLNMAVVKTWQGEAEDGVLWAAGAPGEVVAKEIDPNGPGARAGIQPQDLLVTINQREITSVSDVIDIVHASDNGETLTYGLVRRANENTATVTLQLMPLVRSGLYYSLAFVGILALVVGASVRLRRPNDPATLHFFWLTVAFFGMLAFTPSGSYKTFDYFFDWADLVARLALPPLFLHFALVFPDRPNPWVRTDAGRAILPVVYLPALLLGLGRVAVMANAIRGPQPSVLLDRIELCAHIYLAACLLGGLALMIRALGRVRSVTARRQLRWIVWGSSVGALPFVMLYLVPFLFGSVLPGAEYTAVLLGCIPLAFASAIVRYRLMDIEVIIKKGLVVAAVGLLLVSIYGGTLRLVSFVLGADEQRSSFWALFATLIVAVVAPWLWKAIQAALDRLYYRDRYDYRRALMSFTRDLNSDLDVNRLSTRLVARIAETLSIDRIALFLPDQRGESGRFVAVASGGFPGGAVPAIEPGSALGARLIDGQTVVIDDPVPSRRLSGDEAARWRDAGLYSFVPCVSTDLTIGLIAVGRRAHGDHLSSEDMTLLAAVAGQAATAIENARLYSQLQSKASEIERLHQFSDSVVESLSDGLVVIDLEDRVLRWNRRAEALVGIDRGRAIGRRLGALFSRQFLDTLVAARRDAPHGASLYRVPLAAAHGDKRQLLVNTAIAPFQTPEGGQAGWIIVLEDITDRANLEEQLRLSEKMAAIGLLAAGVAHEVNTPLTGISSFTQLLLERSDANDPRTELLEKIERQTFRAAKIINSLLNLARPSGTDTAPVDINGIVGDVLSLLEHQFKLSHVQVRRELASPAVIVRGVEYKLQQVFLNLFLNARDAMPKGGWLTVSTSRNGSEAIVEVADTGMGIPSEQLARIYDPFFTTKPEGRGTGLGLSVTYGIVQEHGGTLACESIVGQGTRFRLTLPVAEQSASRAGL
jgi:two-component system, NtrC family, sensor kinase